MFNDICPMDDWKSIDDFRYCTCSKEASPYLASCKTSQSGN